MADTVNDYLVAILGHSGAAALKKASEREPALAPLLVPRTALAWLQGREAYEGPIPGQTNSYLKLTKSEGGFTGVISFPDDNYEYQDVSPEYLAAAISASVGVDFQQREQIKDALLVRLGKSIDALVGARLNKAKQGTEPKSGPCDECNKPMKAPHGFCEHCGARAFSGPAPVVRLDTEKTELPGQTAKPREAQGPIAPEMPKKQTAMPKPKLPKAPSSLSIGKSEAGLECRACGGKQFKADRYVACLCLRDWAGLVKTQAFGDGYVLEFKSGVSAAQYLDLKKALTRE